MSRAEMADRPRVTAEKRARRRVFLRRRIVVLVVVVGLCAGVVAAIAAQTDGGGLRPRPRAMRPAALVRTEYLAPGSDPSVLPGPLLIADEGNNRLIEISPTGKTLWQFPRPGDLAPGQTFRVPDDAFFSSDGSQVVATQEDDFVVSVIDVARHRIVWRYGTPGMAGSAADQLSNPDDAMMLRDGSVLTADIKNCRIVVVHQGLSTPARIWGKPYHCHHLSQPLRFASPNGAFPLSNGHELVTEITHDWVSEVDLLAQHPRIVWDVHPYKIHYPSDTNEVRPGVYVTVDYWHPGVIEEFDRTGKVLWFYKPLGTNKLYKPSLAEALPNGDVLATDDYNDRVIVVDPRTDKIVWQYGHLGKPGTAPGYLDVPDGLDLAPPNSLDTRFAR